MLTIRHRPRPRRARTAEQDVCVAQRHVRKGRELLMLQREAELLRVERNRASDIFRLIADAVKACHSPNLEEINVACNAPVLILS